MVEVMANYRVEQVLDRQILMVAVGVVVHIIMVRLDKILLVMLPLILGEPLHQEVVIIVMGVMEAGSPLAMGG